MQLGKHMKRMRIIPCLFLFIIVTLVHHSVDASCGTRYGEFIWDGSTEKSIPTNITEFKKNLNIALNDLPYNETKISLYRWVGVYSGDDPNAAYAQGRCIGYVDSQTCQDCIKNITAMLRLDCSTEEKSALLYHNQGRCMVQYSNHNMIGLLQMPDNLVFLKNHSNKVDPPSSVDAFYAVRNKLFHALALKTEGRPDGYQLFAAGKWYEGSSNNTIYGVAQCSPDLTSGTCATCLERINTILENYFNGIVGGSILGPSCNYQYEIFNFLNGTSLVVDDLSPALPPPPPSSTQPIAPASSSLVKPVPPSKGAGANKALLVIYILAPLVVIGIIIFVGIFLFLMKKKKKKNKKKPTKEVEIAGKLSDEEEGIFGSGIKTEETLKYEFDTVSAATDNFSEANMLGQGGFGAVYKGRFQNGEEIAVKRLSQTSGQGDLEFKNEVATLANLQHRNLVRLLGFCLKKKERILIYEFVANSSLDKYIFDPIKRANLKWDRLYKIIIGVARGILYLHEDSRLRIIHRDLKSSNVLLDNEMTPKIADFGMAKLFLNDETLGNTSRIAGTYGYMAPEYAMRGLFSVKSDVFSFGVLLLEIVCGRRNTFFRIENSVEDLLSYTWKNWQEGTIINLLDPALYSETSSTLEITRCIHIGLLCAQEDDTQRPIMASVLNLLSNVSIALPDPLKPAFFQQRSINQRPQFLQNTDSGHTSNSSGSKNKSSTSWSTDTEINSK